jgi:hypothetical protein
MQVYDVAIETIMLAFCEDCEAHDGHPQHAPPLLLEALGYSKEAYQVKNESRYVAHDDDSSQFIQSPHVMGSPA